MQRAERQKFKKNFTEYLEWLTNGVYDGFSNDSMSRFWDRGPHYNWEKNKTFYFQLLTANEITQWLAKIKREVKNINKLSSIRNQGYGLFNKLESSIGLLNYLTQSQNWQESHSLQIVEIFEKLLEIGETHIPSYEYWSTLDGMVSVLSYMENHFNYDVQKRLKDIAVEHEDRGKIATANLVLKIFIQQHSDQPKRISSRAFKSLMQIYRVAPKSGDLQFRYNRFMRGGIVKTDQEFYPVADYFKENHLFFKEQTLLSKAILILKSMEKTIESNNCNTSLQG